MEEEKIVLMSRYGENNYLERIPNVDTITYVLKTESNTVRVGTENNINMYVDPSGGPMIIVGHKLLEVGKVVKSIDWVPGLGYTITFE